MKKLKSIISGIIAVAIILNIGAITASASAYCGRCKATTNGACISTGHCRGHTIMSVGTATANCVDPGGGIGSCITSGCGATFFSIPPLGHSYTNMVCTRSVSCGKLNTSNSSYFTHYMYRTGNHARRVLPDNRFQTTARPNHNGIDIMSNSGASATYQWPIYVQGGGTVVDRSGTTPHATMGHYIIIDYNNGLRARYLHLDSRPTLTGTVNNTQKIGETGWTGDVSPKNINGTHLHLDVQVRTNLGTYVNPENYFPTPTSTFNFS
jgi:hypothetical protein